MSIIDPPAGWDDVDGINTNERLLGGLEGPLNRAAVGLTARTKQLSDWRDEDLAAVAADKSALASAVGATLVGVPFGAGTSTVAAAVNFITPEMAGLVPGTVSPAQALLNVQAINTALAAGAAKRCVVRFSGADYTIDTSATPVLIPSGCIIDGAGSRFTCINDDAEIFCSKGYWDNSAPTGRPYIDNVTIVGTGVGANQHGLTLRDYYLRATRIRTDNTGGFGVNLDHLSKAGVDVGGNLVEPFLEDIEVHRSGRSCLRLGANNNNRITDGYLGTHIARLASGATEPRLFIGSAAGWWVGAHHGYGGAPASGVGILNAYNTYVGSLYIESGWTTWALSMPNFQRGCCISSIIADAGPGANLANAAVVRLSRSTAVASAAITIGSISVNADAGANLTLIRNENTTTFAVSLAAVPRVTGAGIVTLPGTADTWYTAPVETLRAVASRKQLYYQNFGVPMSNTVSANGTGVKTCTFEIPWIGLSSQVVVDITISARTNNNGALAATFRGYAVINSKALADAWVVNLQTLLLSPAGAFSTGPTATVSNTGQSGTLTVTFEYMAGTNAFGSCHFLLQQSGL